MGLGHIWYHMFEKHLKAVQLNELKKEDIRNADTPGIKVNILTRWPIPGFAGTRPFKTSFAQQVEEMGDYLYAEA